MAKADGLLPRFLHFQTKIKYTENQNIEVQLENVTDHDWVEVVYGKWVPISERWHEYPFYKCSACGATSGFHSHFCPNCGADMREVQTYEL